MARKTMYTMQSYTSSPCRSIQSHMPGCTCACTFSRMTGMFYVLFQQHGYRNKSRWNGYRNKSQHRKLILGKKSFRRSCRESNPRANFGHAPGALPLAADYTASWAFFCLFVLFCLICSYFHTWATNTHHTVVWKKSPPLQLPSKQSPTHHQRDCSSDREGGRERAVGVGRRGGGGGRGRGLGGGRGGGGAVEVF